MKLRSATATAIATAMLATSVTPAMAQGYPGGGYHGGSGRYRNHDHDHIGAGGIIAGIAAIGIIAAIASSSSHNRNSGYDNRYRGNGGTENDAAEACANAAEQRFGGGARVSNIDQVVRAGEGYQVSGIIDTRSYRNSAQQRFTCQVRYGSVERLDVSRGYDYERDNGYRGY